MHYLYSEFSEYQLHSDQPRCTIVMKYVFGRFGWVNVTIEQPSST